MARRGTFIVFEGCDRAGKTTQCRKLVEALNQRNIKSEFMNFPDRSTSIGCIINDYLTKKINMTDEAVHLLFAANRWELVPKIKEKLASGISLIVDRYSYSGVAFSAAKEGMDLRWCWNPEVGLPEPDAVFYLTLSDEASARRGGFGDERYEVSDFQRKVRKNYSRIRNSLWQNINADSDVESLHKDIFARFCAVHEKIANAAVRSIGSMNPASNDIERKKMNGNGKENINGTLTENFNGHSKT